MFCPNCGIKLPDDMVFCPECGTKISDGFAKSNNKSAPQTPEPKESNEPALQAPKLKESNEPVPQASEPKESDKPAPPATESKKNDKNVRESIRKPSVIDRVKGILGIAFGIIAVILVIAIWTGKLDKLAYELGLAGRPDSMKGIASDTTHDEEAATVTHEEETSDLAKEVENTNKSDVKEETSKRVSINQNEKEESSQSASDTNTSQSVDNNELMDTIMIYYSMKNGTNDVAAEIDHESGDIVSIHLYDPYATTTSNNLGYYDYNKKTEVWTDAVTGEKLDFEAAGEAYNELLEGRSSYPTNTAETIEGDPGDTDSEYLVEGTDSGYFEKGFFENMSDEELKLARNEILARHGRTFNDKSIQEYFDSKSWYEPKYSPEDFDANIDLLLNQWEHANLQTIREVEASRR